MKVLTNEAGSVLMFHTDCTARFLAMDGTDCDKGIVAEVNDALVALQIRATLASAAAKMKDAEKDAVKMGPNALGIPYGAGGPFGYVEKTDINRDIRFITRGVTDVAVGTVVGVIAKARGLTLDIPQDATPNRQAGLKVGAKIAVGPNVSPKAFINARGTVVSINGVKATVEFDAGDIDRVNRATGKNFRVQTKMHKSTLEVIA